MKIPQHDFLFDRDGEQLVDYIGRFEELQAGFDHVCKAAGIPVTKLPHANETGKNYSLLDTVKQVVKKVSPLHKVYDDHAHYTEYYDDATNDIVSRLYAREIECFGYRFEG